MLQEELEKAIEVLPNKLYYVSVSYLPKDDDDHHYFCTDEILRYFNYFLDFGPLNICCVHRFCSVLELKLRSRKFSNKKIFYYSRHNPKLKINSILLIASFLIIKRGYSPEEAYRPFEAVTLPFYHDASPYDCDFELTVKHCLEGLSKAMENHLIDLDHFNEKEYDEYEQVENGDMNWVIANKLLAFSGPHGDHQEIDGIQTMTPEDYIPLFRKHHVDLVIRLNKPAYDAKRFSQHGITCYDIYFPDGGLPEFNQVLRFIGIVSSSSGAIAVHCKAGLGRTGTMICAYLMQRYCFSAGQAIAYCRLCRPGSVVGCQQHFLKRLEEKLCDVTEEEIAMCMLQSIPQKKGKFHSERDRRGSLARPESKNSIKQEPMDAPTVTSLPESKEVNQGNSLYQRKRKNTVSLVSKEEKERAEPRGNTPIIFLGLLCVLCSSIGLVDKYICSIPFAYRLLLWLSSIFISVASSLFINRELHF